MKISQPLKWPYLNLHNFPAPCIQIHKKAEGNKDQTQESTFSHLTNSRLCYLEKKKKKLL